MRTSPLFFVIALLSVSIPIHAANQKIIPAPAGSGNFGDSITALPNGNFVVSDPGFDLTPALTNVGAVYLFSPDGTMLSRLTGSAVDDQVGSSGVVVLANGNFVVRSPNWDNGATADAGAVTWGSASTGFIGGALVTVSAANSLVGSTAFDGVGSSSVTALTNGNYVVISDAWDGANANVGAVTWGNGNSGTVGAVSAVNSLVGSTANDSVGTDGVFALTNGNYVVSSPFWNGAAVDVGAVTWGNGNGGTVGAVSDTNSLVGSTVSDFVGIDGITALTNGNYVVRSSEWNNGAISTAGAVTWGNGNGGTIGPVSTSNSLVGSTAADQVGISGVTALTNSNYVVNSSLWDNGAIVDVGAITWGNGNTGTVGTVSPANSLIGSIASDQVGGGGVTALTNGNYVVNSPGWDGANVNVGAVTWGNGNTGTVGAVSAANSLVGSTLDDVVGNFGVTALTNGNYVVNSPLWDGAAVDVGAITWGNGTSGTVGPVSAANSLVGSTAGDFVGNGFVTALTNGNYVVSSPFWNDGLIADVGAVTWGDGNSGTVGPVSDTNSLIGLITSDLVGYSGVTALTNGNYVVSSPFWNGDDVGAVTWGNGNGGTVGAVSDTNSLVGSANGDEVGSSGVTALTNGNYFVSSPDWDDGSVADVGAVTLGDGASGTFGPVSHSNSAIGSIAGANLSSSIPAFLQPSEQLVIGSPNEGRIILFGNRLNSLAVLRGPAPGAPDLFFTQPGPIAVSSGGSVLFDSSLSGTGAAKGKNRAVFADATAGNPLGLVLQRGDAIAALGGGLPANASANSLLAPIHQSLGRAIFQVVAKGSGLNGSNNRLILQDNGNALNPVLRTGQAHHLHVTPYRSFTEVLQSHDTDLIAITHRLAAPGNADSGIVTLRHNGSPTNLTLAPREGQPSSFLAVGDFGQLAPRAALGLDGNIAFSCIASATGKPALIRFIENGSGEFNDARVGDSAAGIPGASLASFPAFAVLNAATLYKARLSGGVSKANNEAIYRAGEPSPRLRKGDALPDGAIITAILRFWPAGTDQVLALVRLDDRSQALILRQSDIQLLELARTRQTMPGTGSALLRTFVAVDVNPVNGHYAILGTLSNSPATANQALWTGNTSLGADTPASDQARRLPVLRLRKGETYSTSASPLSTVKSILLRPAIDVGGAGGRGLHHAIGAAGNLAITLTTLGNTRQLVLLPP